MRKIGYTPFGKQSLSAAMVSVALSEETPKPIEIVDKWELFRRLCTARIAFGVTDRDLTVLNALLSFLPQPSLGGNEPMVVFPSNVSLSQRAHGMAESTLRRHLAALVAARLIARCDSANGKRYAARDEDGQVVRAFGFDLSPLAQLRPRIEAAASEAEAAALRLKRLREEASISRRDAWKLAEFAMEEGIKGPWDEVMDRLVLLQRQLRRKLDVFALEQAQEEAANLLNICLSHLQETEKMSGNDPQNERRHHNSNTEPLESNKDSVEPILVGGMSPKLPLQLVLKACPDITHYAKHDIRHWRELVATVEPTCGMMGISKSAWTDAKAAMGAENAAIVVSSILQKIESIRSPGGYLRALTKKSENGAFSPGPMVMALLTAAS